MSYAIVRPMQAWDWSPRREYVVAIRKELASAVTMRDHLRAQGKTVRIVQLRAPIRVGDWYQADLPSVSD